MADGEGRTGAGARLVRASLAWIVWLAATPGVLFEAGSWIGGALGLALWADACARPGRRAFQVEWLVHAVGFAALMWWVQFVFAPALVAIGAAMGLYGAVAGAVLRRLARAFPLALAAPVAWVGVETLREWIRPPFGLGWQRLGHWASDDLWLAGSARLWGVAGLSFALAALGGALAGLRRGERRPGALALGLGPLALAVAIALASAPPPTAEGPTVLLVQPAFPQERKGDPGSALDNLRTQMELTERGLAEAERAGERVDLVVWGETLLQFPLVGAGLAEAFAAGARFEPWEGGPETAEELAAWEAGRRAEEDAWVAGRLLATPPRGLLPEGCAFASGALVFRPRDGRIRAANAVVLWNPEGERVGEVDKIHLVPGAETMLGLERSAAVRAYIHEVAGYVPDLLPGDGARTLPLARPSGGEPWTIGAAVCFDNAFVDPFLPSEGEPAPDFHLVLSNEAWYESSCEMDQMMAFSRLLAIATGRSIVRATNSGVTAVLAPDGSEVARLVVDGRDREVPGALLATVPVPATEERPPFGAWRPLVRWGLVLLPVVALVAATRMRGYRQSEVG